MNNDLEQFSEERLKKICAFTKGGVDVRHVEIEALARIALSIKQAKPVGYATRDENYDWHIDFCGEAHCLSQGDSLFTNPQPAHTEQEGQGEIHQFIINNHEKDGYIEWADCNQEYFDSVSKDHRRVLYTTQKVLLEDKEGWRFVPEEANLSMLTMLGMTGSFESMQIKYKNMLAAAPKPESE